MKRSRRFLILAVSFFLAGSILVSSFCDNFSIVGAESAREEREDENSSESLGRFLERGFFGKRFIANLPFHFIASLFSLLVVTSLFSASKIIFVPAYLAASLLNHSPPSGY